ncbi:uncharacterized protein F58A4.6 [Epargyreus clarus]|uniref:uncharacterized protein F58A4.6 n=1 Tax=Epargyreus clarus TaxID=520877 RepID=UPI003C2DD75B
MHLLINVCLFNRPFTVCYITEEYLTFSNEEGYKSIGVKEDSNSCIHLNDEKAGKKCKLKASALFLQPFLKECLNSEVYRTNVLKNFNRLSGSPKDSVVFLKLILEPPDKEVIDYSWNDKMLHLVWSRVEIENAFSWLSTLGGAYSALGDYFEHCAEEAGRISVRQYKLSQMLGDESLAARSKLYSALAYAQKGNLKLARHIVRKVAAFARSTQDKRLYRMCQGVWVKLRYMRQVQRAQTKSESECGDSKVNKK